MNAFRGYSYSTVSISSITFPSSIIKIDDYAFEYCSLNELVLPPLVEYIGANAFAHNRRITSLTIPTTVSYIGYAAFASCGLRDISIYPQEILEQQTVESISPSDENNRP